MRRIPVRGAVLVTALFGLACEPEPLAPRERGTPSAGLSPSASRGKETVRFKESFEAVGTLGPAAECPLLQERLQGTGRATHFGRFAITHSHCLDPATGALTKGVFVKTIASGDRVFGIYSGTATPVPDDAGLFAVEVFVEFTDGTGRFTGVSGTATGHGTSRVDFSQPEPRSEVSLRFEGEISSPGSLR